MKKKLSKLLAVCFMLVYGLFFMESQDILAAANHRNEYLCNVFKSCR